MASVLFFFGAGASRSYNIPTMNEMVDEFEETVKDKPEFELYQRIKKIQEEGYGETRVDIESVFSVITGIANEIQVKDFGHTPYFYIKNNQFTESEFKKEDVENAKKLVDELKVYIKKTCIFSGKPEEKLNIDKMGFESLFRNLNLENKHNDDIDEDYYLGWKAYTTNYDLIFEEWWENYTPIIDYFEPRANPAKKFFKVDGPIKENSYIKLHGSLDWRFLKESNDILKTTLGAFTKYSVGEEVMLYPIQQKDLYLHPWITLFQDLKFGLRTISQWFAIGFAFNDEFIREIFVESLKGMDKQLVIINPSAHEIIKKFPDNVTNKIVCLPIKFGDKYFAKQFEDFTKQQKTLEFTIKTTSGRIGIHFSDDVYGGMEILSMSDDKLVSMQPQKDHVFFDQAFSKPADEEWELKTNIPVGFVHPFEKEMIIRIAIAENNPLSAEISYAGELLSYSDSPKWNSELNSYVIEEKITPDRLFINN